MTSLDLSQFYETFFDEADELLADMEQLLLGLDVNAPDAEQLNAIFRAAHSIKGGAATFGTFGQLAETTHLLENLLDAVRRDEIALRPEMIDIFLETKDVLKGQLDAYRSSGDPDSDAYERICAVLRQLRDGDASSVTTDVPDATPVAVANEPEVPPVASAASDVSSHTPVRDPSLPMCVRFNKVKPKDAASLKEEPGQCVACSGPGRWLFGLARNDVQH